MHFPFVLPESFALLNLRYLLFYKQTLLLFSLKADNLGLGSDILFSLEECHFALFQSAISEKLMLFFILTRVGNILYESPSRKNVLEIGPVGFYSYGVFIIKKLLGFEICCLKHYLTFLRKFEYLIFATVYI